MNLGKEDTKENRDRWVQITLDLEKATKPILQDLHAYERLLKLVHVAHYHLNTDLLEMNIDYGREYRTIEQLLNMIEKMLAEICVEVDNGTRDKLTWKPKHERI